MLNHKVSVYVPSNVRGAVKLATQAVWARRVATTLATVAGGATMFNAVGSWVSAEQGLVTEDVVVVEAYAADETFPALVEAANDVARRLATDMDQEAVSVVADGAMSFVESVTPVLR